MTEYKLGMDQGVFDELKAKLRPELMPVELSLKDGSSKDPEVDTQEWSPEIRLDIHHVDVGQGESTVLALMCEETCVFSAVIDGGLVVEGGGALVRLLNRLDIDVVDAVVISHYDDDHFSGLLPLLVHYDQFDDKDVPWIPVKSTWKPIRVQDIFLREHPAAKDDSNRFVVKQTGPVKDLSAVLCRYDQSRIHLVAVDDVIALDCDADKADGKKCFKMTCLAANGGGAGTTDDDENANSLAWLVEFGKYTYYTAGDLPSTNRGAAKEDALATSLKQRGPLTAIKCGHHGAETSTSSAFLKEVEPRVAFISAGKQDGFGHPRGATLLRLCGAPSVEYVLLTNCMYNRPLVNDNYLQVTYADIQGRALGALTACAGFRDTIPDISPKNGGSERATMQLAGVAGVRRRLIDNVIAPLEITTGALNERDVNTEDGTQMKALVSHSQNLEDLMKPGDTSTWKALGALKQGISLVSREVMRSTEEEATYRVACADKARAALREAANRAAEIQDARDAFAIERTSPSPAVVVAGSGGAMGNIVFRMYLEDANKDARVAFMGLHHAGAWRWAGLFFGGVAVESARFPADEYGEHVKVESLSFLERPGSPYYTDKDLQKKEKAEEEKKEWKPSKKRKFEELLKKRTDERDESGGYVSDRETAFPNPLKRRKVMVTKEDKPVNGTGGNDT